MADLPNSPVLLNTMFRVKHDATGDVQVLADKY